MHTLCHHTITVTMHEEDGRLQVTFGELCPGFQFDQSQSGATLFLTLRHSSESRHSPVPRDPTGDNWGGVDVVFVRRATLHPNGYVMAESEEYRRIRVSPLGTSRVWEKVSCFRIDDVH
jgi:hypothetical protein